MEQCILLTPKRIICPIACLISYKKNRQLFFFFIKLEKVPNSKNELEEICTTAIVISKQN